MKISRQLASLVILLGCVLSTLLTYETASSLERKVQLRGEVAKLVRHQSGRVHVATPEGISSFLLVPKTIDAAELTLDGGIPYQPKEAALFFKAVQTSRVSNVAYPDGAAARLFRGEIEMYFFGRRGKRIYRLNSSLSSADSKLKALPSRLTPDCQHKDESLNLVESLLVRATNNPSVLPAKNRVLELATDSDFEYFKLYNSDKDAAFARVQSAVEVAREMYARQLGLTITIVKQNIFTKKSSQPYTSTNVQTLLSQFTSHAKSSGHLGEADAYHLFTGKEVSSGGGIVGGFAFVGTVCRDNAYGYSRSLFGLDGLIFGHELGHNLSAQHTSAGLMKPTIDPQDPDFSAATLRQIRSYINAQGSCLESTESSTGNTKGSKKKKKKRKKKKKKRKKNKN